MSTLAVRVMVQDAWDAVTLQLAPSATMNELKQRALTITRQTGKPEDFLVKFRGAAVDDDRSLAESGVVANASLIVMPRKRRAVR